jgi:D-alanyl-D-alanine carboxypeptidase/D-alanyl-D-alanine-endopeptidase (penicillin-binding protein 4)
MRRAKSTIARRPSGPSARHVLSLALGVAVVLASADVRSGPGSAASASPAGAPSADLVPELDAAVRAIASDRALAGASVGIAILDVESGRILAAVNEHTALNPASNAKLYTAGAALATLHGEHRYETTLSGKLEGENVSMLTIRGYGDPSLTTADLWDMAQDLKAYGISRVDGDLLVDQEFYDDQTTPPAFDQQPNEWASFRAPISAVALDENCVTMTVRPASAEGGQARVQFEPLGFVDVDGSVRTGGQGGADNVELALTPNGSRLSAKVSGVIAADSRLVRYTRRADDPRLLAGYALGAILEKSGIKWGGGVKLGPARGHILAKHLSAPLSSLLYALGKQSDNFYAEMIFRSLAAEGKGRPGKSSDSTSIVGQWLDRIGATDPGVVLKNGSGLFDADRVSAASTVRLLRWAWRTPDVQPEYLAQLSVGGVDGTLHKRFRSDLTKRRVRAKTGTLDDVIALSGYVLRDNGHQPVAFSIFFNHVAGKQDGVRHAADRLVDLIARWSR